MKGSKGKFQGFLIVLFGLMLSGGSVQSVQAAIKSPDFFQDASWSLVASIDLPDAISWAQGSCTTEDYIIIGINATDANDNPDTIMALYKNPQDENGDPVEQYSVAKQITQRDYEHINGMAYNPNTKEIAISGYTSRNPENKACLFIIDATTLEYKRTVQVSNPGYDILGIDYMKEKNQYMLQASSDGGNIYFVTDAEFNFIQALDSSLPSKTIGSNFQDFCVSGDYIISTPLTLSVSDKQYLEIFSITNNSLYGRYELHLPVEAGFVEPESICELSPGEIMLMVPTDVPRKINIIIGMLPAVFNVETSAVNGTITESNALVDMGSDYKISYQPGENLGLESLIIDGKEQDVSKYQEEYTFSSIDSNHTVSVVFNTLPKFKIDTNVKNGSIDGAMVMQKGQSATVNFKGKKHYSIGKVLIDGKKVKASKYNNSYTFKNISEPHTVNVVYRWKYIPYILIAVSVIIVWFGIYLRIVAVRRRRKLRRRRQLRIISGLEQI